MQQLQKVLSDY